MQRREEPVEVGDLLEIDRRSELARAEVYARLRDTHEEL